MGNKMLYGAMTDKSGASDPFGMNILKIFKVDLRHCQKFHLFISYSFRGLAIQAYPSERALTILVLGVFRQWVILYRYFL